MKKINMASSLDKLTHKAEDYPNSPFPYENRGDVYYEKHNYGQAILDYTKAIDYAEALNSIDSDYDFSYLYLKRGKVFFIRADYNKAISDFTKAIKLSRKYVVAYVMRGHAYHMKGNFNQAILDYSKAAKINPNFALAYGGRAISYYYKKEYSKAWDDVYKAESLGYKVNLKFLADLKKSSEREE